MDGSSRSARAAIARVAAAASSAPTPAPIGTNTCTPLAPLVEGSSTARVAARAEGLDPALATTAFIVAERGGKVFVDSTRAGGASLAAAYSPRVRPGLPVSFPVPWDELDRVAPADFTVHTAPALLGERNPWAELLPPPQRLPADLVEEGRTIPIARVQAMHEGKRRARERDARGTP